LGARLLLINLQGKITMNDNDTTYIDRMEQEFKENSERYLKGQAYLDKIDSEGCQPLNENSKEAIVSSRLNGFESEQLHEQMYSMNNYLKVLGSRIMFAKAKERLL
jgi:ribosome-interacting GTPase 1